MVSRESEGAGEGGEEGEGEGDGEGDQKGAGEGESEGEVTARSPEPCPTVGTPESPAGVMQISFSCSGVWGSVTSSRRKT